MIKLFLLAATLTVAPAFSQNLTFRIPFDFSTANRHWQPGSYEVTFLRPDVLQIHNLDTSQNEVMFTTGTDSHAKEGKAVLNFNRYGESYFLSQVWVGVDKGRALPKSSPEKERAAKLGRP